MHGIRHLGLDRGGGVAKLRSKRAKAAAPAVKPAVKPAAGRGDVTRMEGSATAVAERPLRRSRGKAEGDRRRSEEGAGRVEPGAAGHGGARRGRVPGQPGRIRQGDRRAQGGRGRASQECRPAGAAGRSLSAARRLGSRRAGDRAAPRSSIPNHFRRAGSRRGCSSCGASSRSRSSPGSGLSIATTRNGPRSSRRPRH